MTTPVVFFVSYAHADQRSADTLLQQLTEQLAPSKRYAYTLWHDTGLLVGEQWHDEIQQALADCQFGLLLVSPAFLASEYITQQELPQFLGNDAKPILPVLLKNLDEKHCNLHGLEVRQLFRFELPRSNPKSFAECQTPAHKNQFAQRLFLQIEQRLDRLFSQPSGTMAERQIMSVVDVKRQLPRLKEMLSKADFNRLEALLPLFTPKHASKASLAACLDTVATGRTTQEKLADFRALRQRLRQAARKARLSLTLEVDSKKRSDPQGRVCWFTQPPADHTAEAVAGFSQDAIAAKVFAIDNRDTFFVRISKGLGNRAWMVDEFVTSPFLVHVELPRMSAMELADSLYGREVSFDISAFVKAGEESLSEIVFLGLYPSGAVRGVSGFVHKVGKKALVRLEDPTCFIDPDSSIPLDAFGELTYEISLVGLRVPSYASK
jgi:hypothetical protein